MAIYGRIRASGACLDGLAAERLNHPPGFEVSGHLGFGRDMLRRMDSPAGQSVIAIYDRIRANVACLDGLAAARLNLPLFPAGFYPVFLLLGR